MFRTLLTALPLTAALLLGTAPVMARAISLSNRDDARLMLAAASYAKYNCPYEAVPSMLAEKLGSVGISTVTDMSASFIAEVFQAVDFLTAQGVESSCLNLWINYGPEGTYPGFLREKY